MAEYASSWQSAADLMIISFYETKCKICFIKVRFNCKSKKKWGKRMDGNYVHCGVGGSDALWKILLKISIFVFGTLP